MYLSGGHLTRDLHTTGVLVSPAEGELLVVHMGGYGGVRSGGRGGDAYWVQLLLVCRALVDCMCTRGRNGPYVTIDWNRVKVA